MENLKRDSTSRTAQRLITLRDVEEGAVDLRKVGEALAALKGQLHDISLKVVKNQNGTSFSLELNAANQPNMES